jgi:serine/threonine protein kinase
MSNCPNCGKEYNPGDEVCPDCGLVFPFTTDTLSPGTILQGRYEIQELSHTGGMGYIYLAKDKKLYDRLCIVKQVKEPVKSDADLKKLEEEARRMAKLSHSNVAMILDHFVEDSRYFLVVERISGKTLSEVFAERHGQLGEDEMVSWAISMCDVVAYIHKQGIIHRDISPDNVMLTDEGLIKFVDFGTLRELRYITTSGTAGMGKYGYTPPEQWQGKPVPQSDIFALGATVYYLLTGNLPLSKEYLSGQGPQKTDFSPEFPPIRTKNSDISPELEAVLQKALQLDVSDRYSTATEFGQELRNLATVSIPKREPSEQARSVLSVYTDHINFAEVKVGSRATRTLTVRNIGTGRLTGTITTSQPWLKVSPTEIDLETGEQEISVSLNKRYLRPGIVAEGEIDINTSGGRAKATVSLSTSRATSKQVRPAWLARAARRKLFLFATVGVIVLAVMIPLVIVATRNMPSKSSDGAQVPASTPNPAITPPSPSSATTPLPSPPTTAMTTASSKIAFVSNRDGNDEIYVMNADGSNQIRLTNNDDHDNFPTWSPDGKKIAFESDRWGYYDIYVMNADGSNQTRFTYNSKNESPTWSPDGKKIAFDSNRDGNTEIYVMNADGSNQTRLTYNPADDWLPAWSPDGKKIAFESDRDGNNKIYVMNADGSNQIRLTNNPWWDGLPSWSPDGKKIAFESQRDGITDIYIMNADGSNQTRLTYNNFRDDYPTWSPDGKKIAFESQRVGHYEICIMNADGSDQIRLTDSLAGKSNRNPAWSPN